jgi:chromosomal replication initiation ATPase DnaA
MAFMDTLRSICSFAAFMADETGVPMEDVLGCGRTAKLLRARLFAMYLGMEVGGFAHMSIAKAYDHRNRLTVTSAIRKLQAAMITDPALAAEVAALVAKGRRKRGMA